MRRKLVTIWKVRHSSECPINDSTTDKELKVSDVEKEIQVTAGTLKVIKTLSNRYLFHLSKKVLPECSKFFTFLFTSKRHQELKLSVLRSLTYSLLLAVGRVPTGKELIDNVKFKVGSFCSHFELTQSSICILSQRRSKIYNSQTH